MPAIEGRHDGRQLLLPVLVAPPLGEPHPTWADGIALLDTGASRSLITADLASRLALPSRGKHPLVSARATELVNRYAFRLGFLLDDGRRPWFMDADLIGSEFRSQTGFTVIIGMDVLGQADFRITPDRHFRLAFNDSAG